MDDGTISINFIERDDNTELKDGSAWHEAFHLSRRNEYTKYSKADLENAATTYWGFNKDNLLINNNRCDEEYMTYWSQLSFSPQSMPYNSTEQVNDVGGIKLYVSNKYKECQQDHIFRLPLHKRTTP